MPSVLCFSESFYEPARGGGKGSANDQEQESFRCKKEVWQIWSIWKKY